MYLVTFIIFTFIYLFFVVKKLSDILSNYFYIIFCPARGNAVVVRRKSVHLIYNKEITVPFLYLIHMEREVCPQNNSRYPIVVPIKWELYGYYELIVLFHGNRYLIDKL